MTNNSFLHPIFSKAVYTKALDIDVNKLLTVAKKEKYQVAGYWDSVSNHALASINNTILDKKELSKIKKEIMKEIHFYAHNIMKYKNNFEMTKSWFTKTSTDQVSDYHKHNNSMLSAVLYLKTDDDTGKISFIDHYSNLFQLEVHEHNMWNSTSYTFKPEDGLLLIFKSDTFHKVLKHKSKNDRYSLAMNFIPVGPIGKTTSDSFVNIVKIKNDR
tara:strand:+ start:743 stop:1387 length:645 start_codon:yes stop_codon:yes gene_type:complete